MSKETLAPVNVTHLQKYVSQHEARLIMCILIRFTKCTTSLGYSKVEKENGNVYYPKLQTKFFDIAQAVKDVQNIKDSNSKTRKNYDDVIDTLKLVLQDRLKFGDVIPETTDTFKGEHHNITRTTPKARTKTKEARQEEIDDKKSKQTKFSEMFNQTKYGVEK